MIQPIGLEDVSCDLCRSPDRHLIFESVRDNALGIPGWFNLVQCSKCQLVYLSPRPDRISIANYYPPDYWPYKKDTWLVAMVKKILWAGDWSYIRKVVPKGGSVLEIGCAGGDFLRGLKKSNLRLYGLEMDIRSAAAALALGGIKVWPARFEDFDFPSALKFDFVVMKYVLEHLPSPQETFAKLRSILSPRGQVLLSVPNYDSWERRIFGRYWHNFDVPRHFYIFGIATIRQYAREVGFEVIKINHAFVPNDWIGSIARFLRERGMTGWAKFFSIKNLPLATLFLPFSFLSFIFGKSSRLTFILRINNSNQSVL